jgi:hypothetical protein
MGLGCAHRSRRRFRRIGPPPAAGHSHALREPAPYADSVVAVAVVALAAAVAWRVGGYRALAAYIAVHLAYSLGALPGILVFCDRSGESNCGLRFLVGQWRFVVGLILAVPVVTQIRTTSGSRNALLCAAGALVTVQQLAAIPLGPIGLISSQPTNSDLVAVYFFIETIAAAAAAGAVMAALGGGGRRLILLAVLILLADAPGAIVIVGPDNLTRAIGIATPFAQVALLGGAYALRRGIRMR